MLALLLKTGMSDALATVLSPIIIIVLVAASYGGVYWYGQHREAAIWQAKIDSYEQQLKAVQRTADTQIANMKAQQSVITGNLEKQLEAADKRKQHVKTITQEVTKYVTAKADSSCQLTAGFVGLYNLSLSPEVPGLPAGKPVNVDAPVTLKPSAAGVIAANNNAECVERGAVIAAWQQWYREVKILWSTTGEDLPAMPPLPN